MWLLMELMFTEHSNKPLLVKQIYINAVTSTMNTIHLQITLIYVRSDQTKFYWNLLNSMTTPTPI